MAAASVRTAAVSFAVIMMITVDICPNFKSAVGKIFCRLTHITFSATDNENIFAGESIYSTASDTAADKDFNIFSGKQNCQSAVT